MLHLIWGPPFRDTYSLPGRQYRILMILSFEALVGLPRIIRVSCRMALELEGRYHGVLAPCRISRPERGVGASSPDVMAHSS